MLFYSLSPSLSLSLTRAFRMFMAASHAVCPQAAGLTVFRLPSNQRFAPRPCANQRPPRPSANWRPPASPPISVPRRLHQLTARSRPLHQSPATASPPINCRQPPPICNPLLQIPANQRQSPLPSANLIASRKRRPGCTDPPIRVWMGADGQPP